MHRHQSSSSKIRVFAFPDLVFRCEHAESPVRGECRRRRGDHVQAAQIAQTPEPISRIPL